MEQTKNKLKEIAPAITRIALSLVFLWFGTTQLRDPEGWVSFLPEFTANLGVEQTVFIYINGIMEVVLGALLLIGVLVRLSALILGLHLIAIALSVGLFSSIGVRDFGLSMATLSVAAYGRDIFCLSSFIHTKKSGLN